MARDQKVKVRIQAKDEASKEVQKVEKGFGRFTSAVKANAAAIASAVAGVYVFVRALGSIARAAFDSENAIRKMEAAMKTAGDFSKAASDDMQAFAKGLQAVGTESDESILAMVALAKGFVGTNEEAKKLVATALDFKEIAAISFEEAVRRIGRATGGSVEDIAKFDARILNLTKSQLANGEATRLLGEKYRGLNKEMSETAEGGLKKLEHTYQDVLAAFGRGALSASEFSDSIAGLNDTLQNNIGFFERSGIVLSVYAAEMLKGHGHALSMTNALGELNKITKESVEANTEAAKAAREKSFADEEAAVAAQISKEDQEALTKALKDQADAYAAAVDSASAFGAVTSVQLEGQILAIIQALHNQKIILGDTNVEYQRLAEDAGAKIGFLRARIDNLRDGMGDLKKSTEDATGVFGDQANAMDAAGGSADRYADSLLRVAAANEQQTSAATGGAELFANSGLAGTRYSAPASRAGAASAIVASRGGAYVMEVGSKRVRLLPDGRILFV